MAPGTVMPGNRFQSTNPATGEMLWEGTAADRPRVDQVIDRSRKAGASWRRLPVEDRAAILRRFANAVQSHRDSLAECMSLETGRPLWETRYETGMMVEKTDLTLQAYADRCQTRSIDQVDATHILQFKPHGVLVVLGPWNLPGHIPNSHIAPALLAGNSVVFKPSELAPCCGEWIARLWHEAGLPDDVLQVVQGNERTGQLLVDHPDIQGVLFTGSHAAGCRIHQALAGRPEVLAALEMGGNNPLVAWEVSDVDAAVYYTVFSAFATSGQRCVSARRLIVADGEEGDRILNELVEATRRIRVGFWNETPPVFMGPLITADAASQVLDSFNDLVRRGGKALVTMTSRHSGSAFLSPGIVEVADSSFGGDEEIFGPLLQVIRVSSFEEALAEANNTSYGLAAGLLSDSAERFEQFYQTVHAGVINWNRQTAGVSSHLPFGGIGHSGNHRPSGTFAADYCAYPVASLQNPKLTLPEMILPGIDSKGADV